MVRRIVVLALTLVMATAVAASAQYVPGQPGFQIDPGTVPSTGGQVVITGVGCPPSVEVQAFIIVNGEEIFIGGGFVGTDPDGPFEFFGEIPVLPPGEYTVIVKCGPLTLSNILTVTGTTPTSTQVTPLPKTGAETMGFLRVGLGLVAVGGLLLLANRRRRTDEA